MRWLSRLAGAISEASFDLEGAGSVGSMSIPGQAQLEFPEGRVRVTYEQGTGHAAGVFGSDSGPPKAPQMPGLSVRHADGGEQIEFRRFGGAKARVDAGRTRALIGSLMVPEPGTYLIDAPEPFDEPLAEHFGHYEVGPDPKLLFG